MELGHDTPKDKAEHPTDIDRDSSQTNIGENEKGEVLTGFQIFTLVFSLSFSEIYQPRLLDFNFHCCP